VRSLLRAARLAAETAGWRSTNERLEIDLVLPAPSNLRGVPDATNLLGGIADVLEMKTKRERISPGVTAHLGDLALVGLFEDDAQIHSIRYSRVPAPTTETR
jgi:hypothetical protein